MRLGARLRGPKESTKVGKFQRVLISNLDCYNAPAHQASILSGIPGYTIDDVKLSNIYIRDGRRRHSRGGAEAGSGRHPWLSGAGQIRRYAVIGLLYASHAQRGDEPRGDCQRHADARPAFYLDDVNRVDFFAITAPRNNGHAFALHGVKDLRIGWSRAAADTTLAEADNKTV